MKQHTAVLRSSVFLFIEVSALLDPLNFKQLHICVIPDRGIHIPQINNSPHVGPEPHGSARVRLVLADEDGVRHRQQPHQCAMLQELEDL